ncbi:helix-turn-helix domain-containing protein [Corallococcus terminator]|nr:helix-turn-helix transcriptional regulator [Corallococcus terminator]
MARALKFTSREQAFRAEMHQDLIGVRTYEDIYKAIESRILLLCRADHLAVGFANLDGSVGLQWKTATAMPLLKDYTEWASRDFVFQATVVQPNVVLNEVQMLQGRALESTETYQRSRDAKLRLEHTLAALLFEGQQGLKGGIAVYGEGSRFFTPRDQWMLQELLPSIKAAVTAVQYLYSVRFERDLLKAVSTEPGATMVLTAPGRERVRTDAATRLVTKWFSRDDLASDGVPKKWVTHVKERSLAGPPEPVSTTLQESRNGESLQVTFTPSSAIEAGLLTWQVRILERSQGLRQDWAQQLTPKERDAAESLLLGATNKGIALAIGCKEQTVKKHVASIMRKVKVGSRGEFISQGRRS